MTELSRTEALLQRLQDEMENLLQTYEGRTVLSDKEVDPKTVQDAKLVREANESLTSEVCPVLDKFSKRAKEVDPESGKFKYGGKYRERVEKLAQKLERTQEMVFSLMGVLIGVEEASQAQELEQQRREAVIVEEEQRKEAEKKRLDDEARKESERIAREDAIQAHKSRLAEAGRVVVLAQQTEEDRVHLSLRNQLKKFMSNRKVSIASVSDAVEILRGYGSIDPSTSVKARSALQNLERMFHRIVQHPESEECRTINAMNPSFQAGIVSTPGAVETLAAAGFELAFLVKEDEAGVEEKFVRLVLPEPNLENEMDRWMEWFEFLKQVHQLVEAECSL